MVNWHNMASATKGSFQLWRNQRASKIIGNVFLSPIKGSVRGLGHESPLGTVKPWEGSQKMNPCQHFYFLKILGSSLHYVLMEFRFDCRVVSSTTEAIKTTPSSSNWNSKFSLLIEPLSLRLDHFWNSALPSLTEHQNTPFLPRVLQVCPKTQNPSNPYKYAHPNTMHPALCLPNFLTFTLKNQKTPQNLLNLNSTAITW